MSDPPERQPRRSWGGILAIVVILGITGATFAADLFLGASAEQEPPRRLVIEGSYPSTSPSTQEVRLTIGKGRQTVVQVFDASCRACFRELDALDVIAKEHDSDLVAVAVGTAAGAEPSGAAGGLTIADDDGQLASRLGVDEPPMTLIVDAHGNVVGRRTSIAAAELGALLDRARSRPTERAARQSTYDIVS